MPSLLDDLKNETPINAGPASTFRAKTAVPFKDLLEFCKLDYLKKQIEGKLDTHPVRGVILGYLVEVHRLLKAAPGKGDSIEAVEGAGKANVTLTKKNSRAKLDADTIALCNDLGIPLQERTVISFKPDLPDETINAALVALKKAGIDARSLFAIERKMLPTDKTLTEVFKLGENTTNDRMAEILGKVATLTIRPKFGGELAEAFECCRMLLNPTPEEQAAMEQAAAAQAKSGDGAAPKAGSNIMDALKASLAATEGEAEPVTDTKRKGSRAKK